jgi:hypothetical protein
MVCRASDAPAAAHVVGAIFLTARSSEGVPVMVLSRQFDIGCNTAWFLAIASAR